MDDAAVELEGAAAAAWLQDTGGHAFAKLDPGPVPAAIMAACGAGWPCR